MIRTSTPAYARAFAHMRPAGPAPMIRTSTLLSICGLRVVMLAVAVEVVE